MASAEPARAWAMALSERSMPRTWPSPMRLAHARLERQGVDDFAQAAGEFFRHRSGDHAGLVAAGPGPDLGDLVGDGDEVGERFLGVEVMAGGVRLVALDIDAERGA